MSTRRLPIALSLLLAVAALAVWQTLVGARAHGGATVSGVVIGADGPVAGAIVRQQTTLTATTTGRDGAFALIGVDEGITITITAWDEGYFPAGATIVAPATGITLTLTPHPTGDNVDHTWYTSMPDPEAPIGCGHCMVAFPQWVTNAHGTSAQNPRFFSLYNGTDLTGTETITPGYRLDFPGTSGNCATCHAPGAAANAPFTTDMNALSGVEQEGVFCDYCHKVSNVYLDPATDLPYPNMPGVQSLQLNRPPSNTHMFYGPFDDVTRRVSYLAIEKQSRFCAACHQFSFWGTPIYESYAEWLASPYPAQGFECQTCHMAPTGVDYFVYPENGGLIRPHELIASHLQPGAADQALLRNTVQLRLHAIQVGGELRVVAAITNTGAGHHVPTDFPGRHMVLSISARDDTGAALVQIGGETIPTWAAGDPTQPGKAYAKLLRDIVSGAWPVVSYWRPTQAVADNRIPALECDTSAYTFALPRSSTRVSVSAELSFHRVFPDVGNIRGWDRPAIEMASRMVTLSVTPWYSLYLPSLLR